MNFFKKRGNKVYIDEWGIQTEAGFGEYKGTVKHGLASSEESKTKMIESFVDYIFDWEIIWCYFGLHDHWESDWGIVNLDDSLKRGGEAMKVALHTGLMDAKSRMTYNMEKKLLHPEVDFVELLVLNNLMFL